MKREVPSDRPTRVNAMRRGGLVAAALLVATAGLGVATAVTSAEAAAKKKAPITVVKVAGLPKSTTGGSGFKVTATVRNASKKPVNASLVFRLSRDKKLDRKDKRLTSVKTGKLRPRAATKVKTTVRLPKVLPQGNHYVFACVGSSCKAAKTFVLRSDSPPPSADDRGRLTGTLTFTRQSLDTWDSVDDVTKVNVAMNYKGPFAVSNDLVSTGSTVAYDLEHSRAGSSGGCPQTTTDRAKADRTLVVRGDRYTDEIGGDIVDTGFNELDVDLNIDYLFTEQVVTAATETCAPSTVTRAHHSFNLASVRMAKVSRTGQDITYRVESVTGAYSGPVDWESVTGTLTLHLG